MRDFSGTVNPQLLKAPHFWPVEFLLFMGKSVCSLWPHMTCCGAAALKYQASLSLLGPSQRSVRSMGRLDFYSCHFYVLQLFLVDMDATLGNINILRVGSHRHWDSSCNLLSRARSETPPSTLGQHPLG